MGLKLTGVYALLDRACWGDYAPSHLPAGKGSCFSLQSNGQTAGILEHCWGITQIKPKQHLRPRAMREIQSVWLRRGRRSWGSAGYVVNNHFLQLGK